MAAGSAGILGENESDPDRREYTLMAHGSSHRKRMVEANYATA